MKRQRLPKASKAGRRIAGSGEAKRSEIIDSTWRQSESPSTPQRSCTDSTKHGAHTGCRYSRS